MLTKPSNSYNSNLLEECSTGSENNNNQNNVPFKLENPLFATIIKKKGKSRYSNKVEDLIVVNKIALENSIEDRKLTFKSIISKDQTISSKFINSILNPAQWKKRNSGYARTFNFTTEQIVNLTEQCLDVVKSQPKILKITSSVKVFGDIHGQIKDLMKFFEFWGEPSEEVNGDIHAIDYLFLGDFIDRGIFSLDTICLLMALKVKYPNKVHLIRGNHEDKLTNFSFGFFSECSKRISDNSQTEQLVFHTVNKLFDYLPLAAIIDNEILCIHGGLGSNFKHLSDIENISRPNVVNHEPKNFNEQITMDILWSDPSDNDEEFGIQPNPMRDSNPVCTIVKYGPDIVAKFLKDNKLNMIIRAHECVQDGFERFAGGKLITVFSATDYCGRHNNAGAMLIIKSNFDIIPFLIYPEKAEVSGWIEDEEYLRKNPPTPLRKRRNKA